MVGRQNVYINLERADMVLTLRTTDIDRMRNLTMVFCLRLEPILGNNHAAHFKIGPKWRKIDQSRNLDADKLFVSLTMNSVAKNKAKIKIIETFFLLSKIYSIFIDTSSNIGRKN